MYCQFLGHTGIASFLKAPSTSLILMKFGIWVPNMIIFVLVHGLGGCLVQKNSGNSGQSELKLPGRSEKNFFCNFNPSYLAIRLVKLHKKFTTCFCTSLIQDPMVGIWKKKQKNKKKTKNIFNHFVVNALELAVLSGFWRKNAKELLGLISK